MTKFKVGDMVTFRAEITRGDGSYGWYVVLDGEEDPTFISNRGMGSALPGRSPTDVTFRDQAAIAALQAALAEQYSNEHSLQGIAEYAFDLAEALDAERKKRDGGE